jgi:hypothetical protein
VPKSPSGETRSEMALAGYHSGNGQRQRPFVRRRRSAVYLGIPTQGGTGSGSAHSPRLASPASCSALA